MVSRFGIPILFLGIVVSACSSSPPSAGVTPTNTPPRICKTPPASLPQPWFHDATAEVGLAPSAVACTTPGACGTQAPTSIVAVAADLDGDGWVDFITVAGSAARGQHQGQVRELFMNREVNGVRMFVDETASSGLLATRDGAGNRGFNLVNLGDLDNDGDVDAVLCPADEISSSYSPEDPCDAPANSPSEAASLDVVVQSDRLAVAHDDDTHPVGLPQSRVRFERALG